MFFRSILAICLIFLLTTPALAEIQPRSFTLSPMVGGHIFEGDQNLDDAPFWFVGLGYNLTEKAALEAVYTQTDADGESTGDTDAKVRTYRLDALYHFTPEKQLVPYLAVGLGEINTKYDVGGSHRHLLGNIGGGIKYFLNETIALRADLRYLLDFPDPKNNLQYSAGLVFQFGSPAPAPEPVVMQQPEPKPEPAPTPEPEPVAVTAPTPEPVAITPPAPTPAPEAPKDSDGDKVTDDRDKCPNTPAGVSVDQDGCPTKLTLKINFGHDSNQIGPEFDDEIAKAAQCINEYPGNLVHIDGHTDSQGAAQYNQKLSERRATAVKNRLIEKFDIPESRMAARGFGESSPVADNKTKEGRLLNRRVDVVCGAN